MSKNNDSESRDFKGVWIPALIYLDDTLSPIEKLLLAEIDSLDKGDGCYKSDERLAKAMHVSTSRLKDILTSLRKRGYLETIRSDGRRRYLRAFHSHWQLQDIRCPENRTSDIPKTGHQTSQKQDTESTSREPPIEKHSRSNGEGGETPSPSRSSMSFFGKDEEVSQYIEDKTSQLENYLRKRHKVNRRINRQSWNKSFILLLQDLNENKSRLDKIFSNFLQIPHDKYTPQVESAKAFREKFLKIEAWVKRQLREDGEETGPPPEDGQNIGPTVVRDFRNMTAEEAREAEGEDYWDF